MRNLTRFMILFDRFKRKLMRSSGPIKETWVSTPTKYRNMVEYLDWFDSTNSIEQALETGRNDWDFRFSSNNYFSQVTKGTALEIGFGGGRLLLHASEAFEHVIGVDIHDNFSMTAQFLNSQGCRNFSLINRDDLDTLEDGSLDYIYSFIVFQHFEGINEVIFYLEQIERLLSDKGLAHIYFGKTEKEGFEEVAPSDFILRDCSLYINPASMEDLVAQKFEILESVSQVAKKPGDTAGVSGQSSILFKKHPRNLT